MQCTACGTPLADGSLFCHRCGRAVAPPPPPGSPTPGIDRLVEDASKAARDLALAAAQLAQRAAAKAERAARDPKGSGHRAMERLESEIEQAKRDLKKAFDSL
jgi:uncharacterized Zn finger protein (UPF0148 family)